MSRGGARNRSGPKPAEDSARSDRRGYKLDALPAAGYNGPVPDFPLPDPRPRDLAWWEWAWRTPQACAWSLLSESWRAPFVAEWCQVKTDLEESRTAALLAQKFRMEDRIGFSTAGLAEMGWKISTDGHTASEQGASKLKSEPTLREQAASATGWRVIDGDRTA